MRSGLARLGRRAEGLLADMRGLQQATLAEAQGAFVARRSQVFRAEVFDLAVCFYSLQHAPVPQDVLQVQRARIVARPVPSIWAARP